jgi:hypothetical protein
MSLSEQPWTQVRDSATRSMAEQYRRVQAC